MPMYPDTSAAIDRIRAMQKYSNRPPVMPRRFQADDPIPYQAPEPQIDIGELDTGAPLAPMDMPTLEQINTPAYETNNLPLMGIPMGPQHTFTAPAAPSKRDRIASALQKRRQMQARPYGG